MDYPRKKSFAAELLKQRQKKNPKLIAILVVAIIVAIAAVGYALYMRFGEKEIPVTGERPSIAVLPFINMSADEEQEYFCDGMSEEIINALTNVGGLRVIARTSTFFFKDKDYKVQDVGKELNVETVLEGSVRKADNRLRITAQLINVADESHLWSEKFDREIEDVFAIQDEISLAIVEALKVKLLKGEKAAIEKRYTENLEAYDLYLLGRYYWNNIQHQNALEYFQAAIEKDPNFALAYTGIADSYRRFGWGGSLPPEDPFPKAKDAAEKALDIDDTLAEALTSLAWINLLYDWDWSAAESRFKKAITLNPSYSDAHHGYYEYFMIMGRFDEALAEIKRAQTLNPLSPEIYCHAINIYSLLGRYDEGIEQFRKAIDLNLSPLLLYWKLGILYCRQGNYSKAIDVLQKVNWVYGESLLGYSYGTSGKRDSAEQILNKLIERRNNKYVPSMSIAFIYLGLNEIDEVLLWLDKAYDERDSNLNFIGSFPEFDPLRSNPRFKALLKKMGLPE